MNIFFVSLGCDKNLVDSEHMLRKLSDCGYRITDDEQEADVIIVNTCCFIGDAKQESIDSILEMSTYRTEGRCKALIVTGCLAQRYRDEIITEIPEVDACLGTGSTDKVIEAVERCLKGETYLQFDDINRPLAKAGGRLLTTGGHYAYLKIAEGCDKHCTYCIIPKVRGSYRSYPMEQLVEEAADLARGGVKELILVAQETSLYGTDLYGRKCLHELIQRLCRIDGIEWIRLLYCYPEEIYDELIDTMRTEPKFCHYLDLPIQHASDEVLRRMGRKTTQADLKRIIAHLREQIPDIVLRTTLIAGFPGETDEQHRETLDFVNEMEFNRLGAFTYSQEEDTPAAVMPDQISEEVKAERRDEIMELQQDIAFELAEKAVGSKMRVMVEGRMSGDNVYVCRTYADAPGVDGYLFVTTDENLMSGDFIDVVITGANEYDLIGELIS